MSRSSGFEQCHVSKWWDFIYCPATDKQLLSVAPGRKPPRPEDILGRRRHTDRPGVTAAPAGIIRAARGMFPLSPCAAKLEPWPSVPHGTANTRAPRPGILAGRS